MNKLKIALLIPMLVAFSVACHSLNTKSLATVAPAQMSVQAALAKWNTYIPDHVDKITLSQNAQVEAAFNHWKQAQLLVINIGAAMSSTNLPPEQKTSIEANLSPAVKSAADAQTTLVNLVNQFTK